MLHLLPHPSSWVGSWLFLCASSGTYPSPVSQLWELTWHRSIHFLYGLAWLFYRVPMEPTRSAAAVCSVSSAAFSIAPPHFTTLPFPVIRYPFSVSISPPSACLVALLIMSFWSPSKYGVPSLKQLLHPLNLSRILLPWHNTRWTAN